MTNSNEEKTKAQPYLVVNPHTFLKHGRSWMMQLERRKMNDVEIRTDFEVPEGDVILVEPHRDDRKRRFVLDETGNLSKSFTDDEELIV
jgi:hypothetical protein